MNKKLKTVNAKHRIKKKKAKAKITELKRKAASAQPPVTPVTSEQIQQ